jgi:hypothetical protein
MTITYATAVATLDPTTTDRIELAGRRLHEAEIALHDAHQSRVDCWIAAACDRLHNAVVNYEALLATTRH